MSNPALEQRVREMIDAFNRKDFAAAVAGMHDDVVVDYPQSGERIVGSGRLLRMVEGPEAPTFELWRLRSGDDLVTAESLARYPDGGEYMACSIYEFAGDLVAHEVDYFAERFPPSEERSALVSIHDMPREALEGDG
jgi:hypothetical protein